MKIMHGLYRPLRSDSTETDDVKGAQLKKVSAGKKAGTFDEEITLEDPGHDGKPITNQGKYTYLKYGKSDIGKTGCIPIAIYNVMVLKNRDSVPEFGDIVEKVKSLKAPLFGGRMGTDPYMIDAILLDYGVSTKEITDRRMLASEMEEAENGTLFLITQWNDMRRPLKGIHAYVVEKHASDKWACYNLVYREYPTRATNLTEMLGRGRLIVANRIK